MQSETDSKIHLSVVATSRNDNHGGYLTTRMQHFVDGLVAQCKRHRLRAELILVEWNPPADRRPLADELAWPQDCGPCDIRIITVPAEVHARVPHGDKLPLFQMIAKNVGIRRARGRFVLATNIDILFTDEVVRLMRDRLEEGRLYRADRLDVPTHIPSGVDFDEVLKFCKREAFRLHATGFTLVKRDGRWDPSSPLAGMARIVMSALVKAVKKNSIEAIASLQSGAARSGGPGEEPASLRQSWGVVLRKLNSLIGVMRWVYQALLRRELFTNACGDFTLLSLRDWSALRGYPEWPMYSWHLDSILLYQAHRSRIKEIYAGSDAGVFHIEHAPGSGFTPEASDQLFERLQARGIPYLDWRRDVEPMIAEMDKKRAQGEVVYYNDENWGYAGHALRDVRVDRRPSGAGPTARQVSSAAST